MKPYVISANNIPSYRAHSFNVMKMAQGFSKLDNNTEVLTANDLKTLYRRYKIGGFNDHYGLSENIPVRWIMPSVFGFLTSRTNSDVKFSKKAVDIAKRAKDPFIYARSYRVPYDAVAQNIPVVVETHTVHYEKPELQGIYKIADSNSFRGLVTIHDSIKQAHAERGVPPDKILVLEDGVDLDRFDKDMDKEKLRERFNLPGDKHIVTYAGHLYEEKGIELILEIAGKISREDVLFLLVGGYERDVKTWKRYIREHGIQNVRFTGFVSNSLIPKYLHLSDLLLLPYKMDVEFDVMDIETTSPLKLFEYMASECPIVAAQVPVLSKVLENDKSASFVPPDNTNRWVEEINRLLDNPSEARMLGSNAYKSVQKYTWKKRCQTILDTFLS